MKPQEYIVKGVPSADRPSLALRRSARRAAAILLLLAGILPAWATDYVISYTNGGTTYYLARNGTTGVRRVDTFDPTTCIWSCASNTAGTTSGTLNNNNTYGYLYQTVGSTKYFLSAGNTSLTLATSASSSNNSYTRWRTNGAYVYNRYSNSTSYYINLATGVARNTTSTTASNARPSQVTYPAQSSTSTTVVSTPTVTPSDAVTLNLAASRIFSASATATTTTTTIPAHTTFAIGETNYYYHNGTLYTSTDDFATIANNNATASYSWSLGDGTTTDGHVSINATTGVLTYSTPYDELDHTVIIKVTATANSVSATATKSITAHDTRTLVAPTGITAKNITLVKGATVSYSDYTLTVGDPATERAHDYVSATSGSTAVATVTNTDGKVSINGVATGTATITLTAYKPDNSTAACSTTFTVTVVETGVSGGVVTLVDLEDHSWSYYSDPKCPIRSLNPADVKITYLGNGNTVSTSDYANPELSTFTASTNDNVKVGIDAPEGTFVYYKTLERTDGATAATVAAATGRCAYTTIPNPFSVRPTYGTNSTSKWRGFYAWRVKSVSGGSIYTSATGTTTIATGDTINAETEVYFAPTSEYGMEVELEALWARAYVVTSNTTTGLNNSVSYERNFVYLSSSTTLQNAALNYPATYTTLDPSTGTGTKRTITIRNNFTCSADTKFENLIFAQYNSNAQTITANGHNLTIGRGCSGTINFIRGVSQGMGNTDYTIRLESGTYNTYAAIDNTNYTHSSVFSVRSVFGCDYDRASNDNAKLSVAPSGTVYGGTANQTFSSQDNRNNVTYDWTVKSGKIQENVAVGDAAADKAIYTGNSINGNDGTQYNGRRRITVEGGEMASIAGGVDCYGNYTTYGPNDGDNWKVKIRLKGGTIRGSIYGAAAYGGSSYDRVFVFTGGTINGWIAGGCNGTQNTGGQLFGSTNLYIGGNVNVVQSTADPYIGGTSTYGTNGAYGGNIFGAGCGIQPSGYNANDPGASLNNQTVGKVFGSTVVIADNAIVGRDVYGGGNFGQVDGGTATGWTGNTNKTANLHILGGTVKGKVYGGSNNQQGQTVNITMKGGTIEGGLYGGSNSWGTINNSVTMQINGGQVGTSSQTANIHGGGYGSATRVSGNVSVTLGTSGATSGATIYGDVYGGSALGNIGSGSGNKHSVTLHKGTIYGGLYGGGLGSTSPNYAAAVNGDVQVAVTGGSVLTTAADPDGEAGSGSVFGANNVNGAPTGTVSVDIYGTDQPASGYALHGVYGGGNRSDYGGIPTVTVHGCDNSIEYVYGGGNASDVAGTQVTIWGGVIGDVFGGGNGFSTTGNHDDSSAPHYNPGADVGAGGTSVTIHGGNIGSVFGGSNQWGDINGPIKVEASVEGEDGADPCAMDVTELYGGGNEATIYSVPEIAIECNVRDGIAAVFGGSKNADMGSAANPINIATTVKSGIFNEIFGGNNLGGTIYGNIELNLQGGEIGSAFGGNNAGGKVNGTITVKVELTNPEGCDYGPSVTHVYGGGKNAGYRPTAGVSAPTPVVRVHHGTVLGNVFGGGYGDTATCFSCPQVYVGYSGTDHPEWQATVNGNVYGGGELANVEGDTKINILRSNTTVRGNVFGGGKGVATHIAKAQVMGNTEVVMTGGRVDSSLYGGGELASVGRYTYNAATTALTGYTSGGRSAVSISGGSVGPDNMKMDHGDGGATPPDFTGHVFGAGKGTIGDTSASGNPLIPALAYVHTTLVTVSDSAFVKGSVYGGSENGHVMDSTHVRIQGGQVGNGDGVNRAYTAAEWAAGNPAVLKECASWTYDSTTNRPYDKYANLAGVNDDPDLDTGAVVATDGHTFFGNVFGGGSGYFPYAPGRWVRTAGRVGGNTRVEITGGHILTSVYGGNELTDVVDTCTVVMSDGTVGVPRTQPGKHPVTCNLYGAGKGDQRTAFNQWTNVQAAVVRVSGGHIYGSVFGGGEDGHVWGDARTAISDSALVGTDGTSGVDGNVFGGGRGFSATALTAGVVCGNVDLTISGGTMLGSVYGGGRLASVGTHLVQPGEASYGEMQAGIAHGYISVGITGGTIGNRTLMGSASYRKGTSQGDVFGGGKGMMGRQQLGLSKNTLVTIGGTTEVLGNVYGGGEIASVGWYEYDTTATEYVGGITTGDVKAAKTLGGESVGHAEIQISGGTIGIGQTIAGGRVAGKTLNDKGHVFGGCLGMSGSDYVGYSYVNDSKVSIGGGTVCGSVFGGGENGHVMDSTWVVVSGGTVGMELEDTEHTETNGQGTEIYFGNVYGGGRGIDRAAGGSDYSVTAGRVGGNTRVHVSGGRVTHNVYGGGSLASTSGDSTTVRIDGSAVIGYADATYSKAGINEGRVFGSARGEAGNTGGTLTKMAFTQNTRVTVGGHAQVRGSVFGGGENGHVRHDTYVRIADGCKIGVELQGGDAREDESTGVGPTVYRGNVYGGGRGVNTDDGSSDEQHLSSTAGRVYGNAYVYITGGTIYHHVYGGGSLASVGDTVEEIRDGKPYDILGNPIEGQYTFVLKGKDSTVTRPYRKADPVAGTGLVTVRMVGGQIGLTGINQGRIYASGRGIAGNNTSKYTHLAYTHNTVVEIADSIEGGVSVSSPYITGAVFGGGANGHVTQNTQVNVSGGTIGARLTQAERAIDSSGMPKHHIYRGNVYGGGRGVDPYSVTEGGVVHTRLSETAGRVFGNTEVNISGTALVRHSVYGGGSLASVGTYSLVPNSGDGSDTLEHIFAYGTGHAEVRISGGRIGPSDSDLHSDHEGTLLIVDGDTLTDAQYTHHGAADTLRANLDLLGKNEGSVYGSGRGVATGTNNEEYQGYYTEMAFTHDTRVVVSDSAQVVGSVFGGGENGHVREDAQVEVSGGTVGLRPLWGTDAAENASGVGPTIYRGNVYGGGRGVDNKEQGGDGEHWLFSSTAGRVYGNATISISGGTIYHHVYGGGSIASVGRYVHDADGVPTAPRTIREINADGDTLEQATGKITITVSGGQIGTSGINEGRIYGGGRGIAGSATWQVTHLAYCRETEVNILPGADVRGSVFGGGANGHVFGNAAVNVSGGHIGYGANPAHRALAEVQADLATYIPDGNGVGRTMFRGNVYGGGRGVDPITNSTRISSTAGRVYGNTSVAVSGTPVILHNVYGGGSLASVGSTDADGNIVAGGRAEVSVSGGTLGWNGMNNGQVYGSGRGMAGGEYSTRAYVRETSVSISDSARILGSVFGSGENGHVQNDASVSISGGFVGQDIAATYASLADDERRLYDFVGNVYGAGRGVDTASGGYIPMHAGAVRGNTTVTVTGGTICRNVYGGGSMGIVGDYGPMGEYDTIVGLRNGGTDTSGTATVIIRGTVGTEALAALGYGGNVYGSSRGRANTVADTVYDDMAYVFRTDVRVDSTASLVWGSVYGGGENGHVDFGGTRVSISEGTVKQSVFGGGKGGPVLPTAGIVDGNTYVEIGTPSQSSNSVRIGLYVFGGNDAGSAPLGVSEVHLYRTDHPTADNTFPSALFDAADTATLHLQAPEPGRYALKALYGGGNQASSLRADDVRAGNTTYPGLMHDRSKTLLRIGHYASTTRTEVTVHDCRENTVQYVYGGGRAANTTRNVVLIEGGRVYQAFAGGDGSGAGNPGADVYGDASLTLRGGIVHQAFGGSNTRGLVRGTATVDFSPDAGCPLLISEVFGGGNEAPGGSSVVTIPCGLTGLGDVYGGANLADIGVAGEAPANVELVVKGGQMRNVYGGSKGSPAQAANIYGNVKLRIYGGSIESAFGGSNINGNITGRIDLLVDLAHSDSTCASDPQRLDILYGGSNQASYAPDPASREGSPRLRVLHDTITTDIFGGGLGATATSTSSPSVELLPKTGGTVRVLHNVYGGGSAAPVVGNPSVKVVDTHVQNNIFGGGLGASATVTGNTSVDIRGLSQVDGNVYGGGNAGEVTGDTDVQVGAHE